MLGACAAASLPIYTSQRPSVHLHLFLFNCVKHFLHLWLLAMFWQCVTWRRSWTRSATAVGGRVRRQSMIAYRDVSPDSLCVWPSTIVELTGIATCTISSQPNPWSGMTAATDTRSSVTRVRNSDNNWHAASHIFLCREKQTWPLCLYVWLRISAIGEWQHSTGI